MLVNEGARILEEGIALCAIDIDIIESQERLGIWWEPTLLLQRLAEQGKTFAEFSSRQSAAA